MCGIAGHIQLHPGENISTSMQYMLDAIAHRGPDGEGIETFEDCVALGHRRLAILDLSKNGRQPMCWRGRYWITYNGEIYNYIEIRRELQRGG